MEDRSDPCNERISEASRTLQQALRDWLSEDCLATLDDRRAPRFDPSAQMEFLKRVLTRAVVVSGPQVEGRLGRPRRREALLTRQEEDGGIGALSRKPLATDHLAHDQHGARETRGRD
jgi:hypothetical protein